MAGRIYIANPSQRALAQLIPVLASQGFEVMGTTDEKEALTKLERDECDMVIVGASQIDQQPDQHQPTAVLIKPKNRKDTIGVLSGFGIRVLDISNVPEPMDYITSEVTISRGPREDSTLSALAQMSRSLATGDILSPLGEIARETGADYAGVMEWNNQTGELILEGDVGGATHVMGSSRAIRSLARSAVEKGEPVRLLDGKSSDYYLQGEIDKLGITSAFSLPLKAGDTVVGAVNFVKFQGQYSQDDVYKASVFSPALGMMIENTRIKEELETGREVSGKSAPQLEHRKHEIRSLNELLRRQQMRIADLESAHSYYQERYAAALRTLVAFAETGDPATPGHSALVAQWIGPLAESMGVEIEGLAEAAYLHDIALSVRKAREESERTAPSPTALDLAQYYGFTPRSESLQREKGEGRQESAAAAEKKHPIIEEELARNIGLPEEACLSIRHHHERYYGNGYPDNLSGENIPVGARLLAVVDGYAEAVYEGTDEETALATLRSGAGVIYDPAVVEAFVKLVGKEKPRPETEVISTVSHELRSPLSSLVGFSELLAMQEDLDPAARKRASEIHSEAQRMDRMVQELLNISRLESGRMNLNRVGGNVEELLEQAAESARMRTDKHDVKTEVLSGLPEVNADRDLILQVLDNLLTNAINYSPDGGTITIGAARQDSEIRIEVSDEGIGISADQREAVFQKFYRADTPLKQKVDGTGLGLSLCKSIVESHGGRIGVESEEGRGSTFYFTLPLWGTPPF
ncbi:MAG: ATP-binding protein [Chloroflexota bacterium]